MTDEEVQATIRAGRILTLKELERLKRQEKRDKEAEEEALERALEERVEMQRLKFEMEEQSRLEAERKERELEESKARAQAENNGEKQSQHHTATDPQTSETDSNVLPEGVKEDAKSATDEGIKFNPDIVDKTFLTGVHITGNAPVDNETASAFQEEFPLSEQGTSDMLYSSIHDEDDEEDETLSTLSSSTTSSRPGTPSLDLPPYPAMPHTRTHYRSPAAIAAAHRRAKLAQEQALPSNIQASLRALRHALSNPISYWRVLEDSYAKPTFASTIRWKDVHSRYMQDSEMTRYTKEHEAAMLGALPKNLAVETHIESRKGRGENGEKGDAPRGLSAKSFGVHHGGVSPTNTMWTSVANNIDPDRDQNKVPGDKGSFGDEEARDMCTKLNAEIMKEVNGKPKKRDGSRLLNKQEKNRESKDEKEKDSTLSRNPVAAAEARIQAFNKAHGEKNQAKKGGKTFRPKDEFEEMYLMMSHVDEKIMTIETNLAQILESDALQRCIPKSRGLLTQIQKEYNRIEQMYQNAAQKAIKANPTNIQEVAARQ
ncbi:hypothetical protein HDV05_000425 [Chytridiales sp. JEL 0842]|nr:hypothetical protein HDV05_000425 [Chytridiales sp. JEL 0842]